MKVEHTTYHSFKWTMPSGRLLTLSSDEIAAAEITEMFQDALRFRWLKDNGLVTISNKRIDESINTALRVANVPALAEQPAQPLTDEQIAEAMLAIDDPLKWGLLQGDSKIVKQFARAVEQAVRGKV